MEAETGTVNHPHFTIKTLLEWIKENKEGVTHIAGTVIIGSMERGRTQPTFRLTNDLKRQTYEAWENAIILHALDDYIGGTLLFLHEDGHCSVLQMALPPELIERYGGEAIP